jgi:VWFA-related protein
VLGRGLNVLHDFASDTESLLYRISQWEAENSDGTRSDFSWEQLQSLGADFPQEQTKAMQRFAEFVTRNRILQTLSSLEALARHLAGVTGRKNLIWVSSGFPWELTRSSGISNNVRRTACTLNDCNVAIYPVDARGLFVDPQYSVAYQAFSIVPEPSPLVGMYENVEAMRALAEMTGGKAFYNRNDIAHAIGDAAGDGRSSYLLGYYRSEPPDNRFKEIQVKVNRSDVILRYRKGFVASRAQLNADETRQSQLQLALWSPLDDRSIGLEAFLEPVRRNEYRVTVRVDPSGIDLQKTKDGWTGRLEFAFASKDTQGRSYGKRILDTIELNLKQQTMNDVSRSGISYRKILVFAPEARLLRIVVRDPNRSLLGSLTVPLPLDHANSEGRPPLF